MNTRELKVNRCGNDRATVSLIGDHDSYTADQLARTVRMLLAEKRNVEVDLREATFIDSVTVGALIEAHRWAREADCGFSIGIGDTTGWAVRRLFELTQLDLLLSVSTEH
jgi:anti-anti-sigma factor